MILEICGLQCDVYKVAMNCKKMTDRVTPPADGEQFKVRELT
jgi:hypothetical protein